MLQVENKQNTNNLNINVDKNETKMLMLTLNSLLHSKIIFNLSEENFDLSIQQTMNFYDFKYLYTFNLILIKLIHNSFISQNNSFDIHIKYLKTIKNKEEENKKNNINNTSNTNNANIIEQFLEYIIKIETQETYYIINEMITENEIDKNIIKNMRTKYFAHYKSEEENKRMYPYNIFNNAFIKNFEKLSKNDFELHKQYVKEGHNPNEIAKIIRNDEIEKLQEISSQTNFDFNKIIEPSLYERYSFINHKNVTLIDYAAYFGSIKCFKYLLMNGANAFNAGKYAVAGGNLEIIHLCEQNYASFEDTYETAIEFHRNDIFKYFL